MDAPFRFLIEGIEDLERLMVAMSQSPLLVPGLLHLTEGLDLLAQQLAAEGRAEQPIVDYVNSADGIMSLFHTLWAQPLTSQRPRFLRLEARAAADPDLALSMRLDVPTIDNYPRWLDVESCPDRARLPLLLAIYQAIGQDAGLELYEV